MRKARFSVPINHTPSSPRVETKKKEYLINKFNLTKETIQVDDIKELINKLNSFNIENIKIETAQLIFNMLDKKKKGSIITEDFIEEVIKNNTNIPLFNKDITMFFTELNQAVETTSEKIILKLKKMKNESWLKNDKEGNEDINWIINVITQENLYDLDTNIIQKHWNNKQKQDEIAYLIKYSDIEGNRQKADDYRKIRKESKIYKVGIPIKNEDKEKQKQIRRETRLNEVISPSIILTLNEQMNKIDTPEFNIFKLNEILDKKTSIYIAQEILGRFEIIQNEIIPKPIFKNFIEKIVSNYDRINAIYHNDLHAGDVMQTSNTIITKGNLSQKMKLGQLDSFSLLVACLCHDYKHPGQNNLYQINAKTKYAMRYNDISVLENYHVSQTFKVLQKNEYNIFINFSPEEYRICRRRMIDCILSTDMANHQKVLSAIKIKMETYDIKKGKNFEKICQDNNDDDLGKLFENQQCILNMIIHGSEISNPAKPDKISNEWTKRVYGEFFVQGDLEKKKGLSVSMFCDRETTNVNKAMIGFIKFVVLPSVNIIVNLVYEVKIYVDYCKFNLKKHELGLKNDEKKERALKKKSKVNKV
jgi:hypothetical protein